MKQTIQTPTKINGILLVNKPPDFTSNTVLQKVKHYYHAKKAGHTGSLDPMATGMLPICFGEATKFCQYLLDADKCYEVVGQLGMQTNTGDATGEVIRQAINVDISLTDLKRVLGKFIGSILQTPSMFSALKHHGQPLYKYARAGIHIERPAREITIHSLQLNHFDGKEFHLKVTCSKGTYIRNLIEDIGEQLGVYAHVTKLHRNYTAGFMNETMYSLSDLQNKSMDELALCLLPLERAVMHFPQFALSEVEAKMLYEGKMLNEISSYSTGCVRLHKDQQFMGLGEILPNNLLKVKRLLAI